MLILLAALEARLRGEASPPRSQVAAPIPSSSPALYSYRGGQSRAPAVPHQPSREIVGKSTHLCEGLPTQHRHWVLSQTLCLYSEISRWHSSSYSASSQLDAPLQLQRACRFLGTLPCGMTARSSPRVRASILAEQRKGTRIAELARRYGYSRSGINGILKRARREEAAGRYSWSRPDRRS